MCPYVRVNRKRLYVRIGMNEHLQIQRTQVIAATLI